MCRRGCGAVVYFVLCCRGFLIGFIGKLVWLQSCCAVIFAVFVFGEFLSGFILKLLLRKIDSAGTVDNVET